MKKNEEIERLRGIAILLVLISHFALIRFSLPKIFRETWIGVDLFFVISGFVVTNSFIKSIPSLANLTILNRLKRSFSALKAFYIKRMAPPVTKPINSAG